MTRHFGVLIPSTNTTVEMECRLLPPAYQAHVGRLMTSTPGRTFSPSLDEDIEYQSRLLGTAKVEMVILAQTSASLFADDYDEVTTRRMSEARGYRRSPRLRPSAARCARCGRTVSRSSRPIRMRSTSGRPATSRASMGSRRLL